MGLKMNKKIFVVGIIGLLLLIVFSCGCFEEDNEEKPDKPPYEYNKPYYTFEIMAVTGSTLNITDAKFECSSKSDTILYTKTVLDANPTSIRYGESIIYPIPSGESPVTENVTTGDGDIIDNDSISNPEIWEYCYFAYIDSEGSGKVDAGDVVRIYKDYNNDEINEVKVGYKFKILDNEGNERYSKKF
jgi:hypothetical protein